MARIFLFATTLTFVSSAVIAAPDAVLSASTHPLFTTSPAIWNTKIQGNRVTALCKDARGRVFAASEENGLWMRDQNGAWTSFTPKNSHLASDMIYALAVDKQSRVWAGTLNRGVSVWNGREWRTFGVAEGLASERVFDIAIAPNGDVWIATSGGLTRYIVKNARWQSFTRASGFPSDQVQALSFGRDGTLYAATQNAGLAIGSPRNEYSKWKRVVAPQVLGTEPQGAGLPSNFLNDVLVSRTGIVYVATTAGLARSRDGGATWNYVRGANFADKVRGRYRGAPNARWQPKAGANLREDIITSLAEDDKGRLYLGYRQYGFEVFDAKTGQSVFAAARLSSLLSATAQSMDDYTFCLLALPDGEIFVGTYGAGLFEVRASNTQTSSTRSDIRGKASLSPAAVEDRKVAEKRAAQVRAARALAALSKKPHAPNAPLPAVATGKEATWPQPATPLSATTLKLLLKNLSALKTPLPVGSGVFEGDDWRTQGDWIGHYGRQYALMFAMQAPTDHEIATGWGYDAVGDIGPHRQREGGVYDSLRRWVHWHRADNNRNVLYNPILGYRREAEADDHAENWSMNNEGSGVYVRFQVPAGVHRASFYFYNKDGENGHNRFRDYGMQLKADAPDVRRADALPAIASARVRDFRGGVYKRFIVHGPARYWLQVDKNYSFNTILQAVFLDKLRDEADVASKVSRVVNANNRGRSNAKRGLNLWMGGVQLQAPNPYRLSPARQNAFLKLLAQKPNAQKTPSSDKTKSNAAVTLRLARQVWQRLDDLQGVKGVTERQWSYRLQLLRTVEAVAAQQNVQAAARFRLTDKRAKTAVDVSSDATSSTRTNAPHWTGDASVAQAMRMQALIENWRWQLALWTPQDRADFDRATERARKNFGALRVMKTPAPKSP